MEDVVVADTRRRRDPEARPHQILDAAFYEFAEHGLAGARLDDIAKRAAVAKGTIYLYFPTKEALFREMVRTTIVAALEMAELRREETQSLTASAQIRAVATGYWARLRTEPFQVVHRLVLADLPRFPDLMQFYADEVIMRGRRLFAGIVSRGIAAGEFRDVDPESAARMLSALAISHSQWCSKRQHFPGLMKHSDDEIRDEVIDFYLHALRPDASVSVPAL